MTNAFDANVPKRKPKTRLSGILADADAQSRDTRLKPLPSREQIETAEPAAAPEPAIERPASGPPLDRNLVDRPAAERSPLERAALDRAPLERSALERPPLERPLADRSAIDRAVLETARGAIRDMQARLDQAPAADASDLLAPEPMRARQERMDLPPPMLDRRPLDIPGDDVLRSGQERLADLRLKIQRASLTGVRSEPAATAGRIRDTVTALRTQLHRTSQDRAEVVEALRDTRRELLQAQRELETLRSERDQARALAAQHREVAEELLSECDALSQERDAAMARIQEFRSLESEQGSLLEQLSSRLTERETVLVDRERELAETREALIAVEGEGEIAQLRLDELLAENRRLQERTAQSEAELEAAGNARDALLEIQRLVESLPI